MMQFNELVKGKKAHVLEAPITGGLEALKKGQMTVFMAGEKDLAEQVISICFIIFLYDSMHLRLCSTIFSHKSMAMLQAPHCL